jgi:hypothetical protein
MTPTKLVSALTCIRRSVQRSALASPSQPAIEVRLLPHSNIRAWQCVCHGCWWMRSGCVQAKTGLQMREGEGERTARTAGREPVTVGSGCNIASARWSLTHTHCQREILQIVVSNLCVLGRQRAHNDPWASGPVLRTETICVLPTERLALFSNDIVCSAHIVLGQSDTRWQGLTSPRQHFTWPGRDWCVRLSCRICTGMRSAGRVPRQTSGEQHQAHDMQPDRVQVAIAILGGQPAQLWMGTTATLASGRWKQE